MTFVNTPFLTTFLAMTVVVVYLLNFPVYTGKFFKKADSGWGVTAKTALVAALLALSLCLSGVYYFRNKAADNIYESNVHGYTWGRYVLFSLTYLVMELYKAQCVKVSSYPTPTDDVTGYEDSTERFKVSDYFQYKGDMGLLPFVAVIITFVVDSLGMIMVVLHAFSTEGVRTTIGDYEYANVIPYLVALTVSLFAMIKTPQEAIFFYNPRSKFEIEGADIDSKKDVPSAKDVLYIRQVTDVPLPELKCVMFKIPPLMIMVVNFMLIEHALIMYDDYGRFWFDTTLKVLAPMMMVAYVQTFAAWFGFYTFSQVIFGMIYFFFPAFFTMTQGVEALNAFDPSTTAGTRHLFMPIDMGNTDLKYRTSWTSDYLHTSLAQVTCGTTITALLGVMLIFEMGRWCGMYDTKPREMNIATQWKFKPYSKMST